MYSPTDWYQRQEKVWHEYEQEPDRFGRAYDELFNKLVCVESALSLNEAIEWLDGFDENWGFRGQREAGWFLRTSLDRAVRVETADGYFHSDRKTFEDQSLPKFRQDKPGLFDNSPEIDDRTSLLGLMQHYGAPTRLLDWTMSVNVALFFAIENPPSDGEFSAVWAIDLSWLKTFEAKYLGGEAAKEKIIRPDSLLGHNKTPLIVRVDPLNSNERLLAQKGFFLLKLLDQTPCFDQILVTMLRDPIELQPVIRKLEIHKSLRCNLINRLKEMNISRSSLRLDETSP